MTYLLARPLFAVEGFPHLLTPYDPPLTARSTVTPTFLNAPLIEHRRNGAASTKTFELILQELDPTGRILTAILDDVSKFNDAAIDMEKMKTMQKGVQKLLKNSFTVNYIRCELGVRLANDTE